MSDHRAWDELAAGYALHALTGDEHAAFVTHLDDCARCQANVDEHTRTAAELGSLAYSPPTTEPPSWASIRGAVVEDTAQPVSMAAARRRRYERSRRWLAAAAAVAVLAGGAVAGLRLSGGDSSAPSCRAATADCHAITLRSSAGGQVRGSIVVTGQDVSMITRGMAPAPAGRTYVLWQVPRQGRPTAISQFQGAHSRPVRTTINVPYAELLEFAVSEEPAGAVPPTPSKLVEVGVTT